MTHLGIFVAGAVVTLVVSASLSLLIWGAILDGREEARQRELRAQRQLQSVGVTPRVQPAGERVPPAA